MTLVAAPARAGNWLDTAVPLSDAVLADVAAAGYEGIARYAPLPGNPSTYDLSPGELARICATRRPDGTTLQCLLVQHCRLPQFNNLTKHPAELDARALVGHAVAIGYPTGCHVTLDFEGLKGIPSDLSLANVNTPVVCTGWTIAYQATVLAASFRALMYHGYDVPLSALDLFELPGFDSYWRGLGGVEVATRGPAIRQGGEVVIHGVKFDRNVLAPDKKGDVPWVAQAA